MTTIAHDRVFVALTRPQMFAGVTYTYFVANAIFATELFLLFHSMWTMAFAVCVHGVGMLLCMIEPRFLDLWLIKMRTCQKVRNYAKWQCNSYRA